MKKLLLFVPVLIVVALLAAKAPDKSSSSEGIQFFEGTWKQAQEKAKKEHKLIFLDIYATWCGPCKLLKKNTFPNKEVGEYFNKNFVNITLDGEKEDGAMLAQKYQIPGYPTLLFINEKGDVVLGYPGYIPADGLLKMGKDALDKHKGKTKS